MSKPNIILTGFMATGKTTVGKLLAEQLGYDFVDTDHLIETRAGLTVAEIFSKKGEAAFREMEAAIAEELGDREGFVVSTGGRLMLDPANAAALSKRGRVFCLMATPEDILKRALENKHVRRPLLEVTNPIARIVELLRQREKAYSPFSQVDTSGITPDEVAQKIIGILLDKPNPESAIVSPDRL